MKNTLCTAVLLLCITSMHAQFRRALSQKRSPIVVTHKIQPIQLLTGNFKYAYEFAVSNTSSVEVEMNYRLHYKPVLSAVPIKGRSFYGLLRYKYFLAAYDEPILHGLYLAPTIVAGLATGGSYQSLQCNQKANNDNLYRAAFIDLGYQYIYGIAVVDLFMGMGLSRNESTQLVYCNNSHYKYYDVAFRFGARFGFGIRQFPFQKKTKSYEFF